MELFIKATGCHYVVKQNVCVASNSTSSIALSHARRAITNMYQTPAT